MIVKNILLPPLSHRETRYLLMAKDFIAACERVSDLPYQDGEDDWIAFYDLHQQLDNMNVDWILFTDLHVPEALKQSPLFELLIGAAPTIKPPTKFRRATGGMVEVNFQAHEFVSVCRAIDDEYFMRKDFSQSTNMVKLREMVKALHMEKVNILDFLSTEDTDALMQEATFLKVSMHSFVAVRHHVVIEPEEYRNKAIRSLWERQGFFNGGSRLQVPPYPPSQYGLGFDVADFLLAMQDAEADSNSFVYPMLETVESLDVLHRRIHQLRDKDVTIPTLMAGREPAPGTPGATIFKYLLESTDNGDYVVCDLFFLHVATNGNGAEVWNQPPTGPPLLTRDEATTFVNALVRVDISSIPRDAMRCSHCWGDFDEVQEGADNTPRQLPCDHRHMLGRDCLIEILTTSRLCPLCRVDIVAMGPTAPDTQ
jgi:hypothetical protein